MKARILAIVLVAVVVISGMGMGLPYQHNENALREKERIFIKQDVRSPMDDIESAAWE